MSKIPLQLIQITKAYNNRRKFIKREYMSFLAQLASKSIKNSRSRSRKNFLLQNQQKTIPLHGNRYGLKKKTSKDVTLIEFEQTLIEKTLISHRRRSVSRQTNLNSSLRNNSLAFDNLKRLQNMLNVKMNISQNKKYILETYLAANYAVKKLKLPSDNYVETHQMYVNQATCSHQKFLFMNLDQTTIYSKKTDKSSNHKNAYSITFRPHLIRFLEFASRHFELYFFSNQSKTFTEAIIQKINKNKPYIKDYLDKSSCFLTKRGYSIKDLRIIKNRQLKDIVLIDHSVYSFGLQLNNGIPIPSFSGNKNDCVLLDLIPFLEKLSEIEDVRTEIKKQYDLQALGGLSTGEIKQALLLQQPTQQNQW